MDKAWNSSAGDGEHVTGLLSEYIDGSLGKEARAAVLRHLQSCADCKADYIELSATRRLMSRMPVVVPPRAFTLTPDMVAPVRRPGFLERLFIPRNTPRFAFGSVLSLALMMFVLLGSLVNRGSMYAASPVLDAQSSTGSRMQGTPNAQEKLAEPTVSLFSRNMENMADATSTAMPAAQSSTGSDSAIESSTAGTSSASAPAAGGSELPGGVAAGGQAPAMPPTPTSEGLSQVAGSNPPAANAGPTVLSTGDATPTTAAASADATPEKSAATGITGGVVAGSSTQSGLPTPFYPPLNSGGIGSPTTTSLQQGLPFNSRPASNSSNGSGPTVVLGALFALLSVLLAAAAFVSSRRGM